MIEKPKFDVFYSEEVIEFLNSIDEKAKIKITYNIEKSKYINDNELLKKLKNTEIWEFRTLYNSISYRILAFWDKQNNKLIICTHGFIKKTDKTQKNEIEKAEQFMKQYFKN